MTTTTTPNGPCPSCGHCPTCGRSASPYYIQYVPYVPYYPYTPNGYVPQWYGATYVTAPSVEGSAWTYTLQAAEPTGSK